MKLILMLKHLQTQLSIFINKQIAILHLATCIALIIHLQPNLVKHENVKNSNALRNTKFRISILERDLSYLQIYLQ